MYISELTKKVICIKTKSSMIVSNKTKVQNMGDYSNFIKEGMSCLVTITTDNSYYFVHNTGTLMPVDLFMDVDEWREKVIDSLLN